MSKESVKNFFIKVEHDETLKKNFLASIEGIKPENQNEAAEKIIQTAKAAGFDFNAKDLFEARAELIDTANSNRELSNEDLNSVSGGDSTTKGLAIAISAVGIGGCAIISVSQDLSGGSCPMLP